MEWWKIALAIGLPGIAFIAGGIAFWRYILPRLEARLGNAEGHITNLISSHFVKHEDLEPYSKRMERMEKTMSSLMSSEGCKMVREECQQFLCGKIDDVKQVVVDGFVTVHKRIDDMDNKRETAKDAINNELAGMKEKVARIESLNTKKVVDEVCKAVREEMQNGDSGNNKT